MSYGELKTTQGSYKEIYIVLSKAKETWGMLFEKPIWEMITHMKTLFIKRVVFMEGGIILNVMPLVTLN